LDGGLSASADALAVERSGNLYVGGFFITTGAKVSPYFGRWEKVLYTYLPYIGRQ
jgi:hypothetical protein